MLRPAHIIQCAVIGLLGLAVIMVHSAGMTIGQGAGDAWDLVTSRHTIYAVIAIAVLMLASRVNIRQLIEYRDWTNPLWPALLVSLALVGLAMVPGVGTSINGARRWLAVGPITFQPSELVKWIMVVAVALWCTRRRGAIHRLRDGLLPIVALVALACGLIVIEDLGTAFLIALVAGVMLIAGGASLWHVGAAVPIAGLGVVAAIIHSPYRMARLTAFMDPWADPRGTGYHAIQSMLAIAQGGLFGRGLGNGIQKFGYVPADTTDFIFAIICEELGIVGALMVIVAYASILWAGMGIVRASRDTFGRLFALGIMLTLGFQAMINLAVVTVVVPTKGIALPLLSAGGTGWVMTALALGLVAGLDEANRLDELEPAPLAPAV